MKASVGLCGVMSGGDLSNAIDLHTLGALAEVATWEQLSLPDEGSG